MKSNREEMSKYIETDCELIKITYVAENKPDSPSSRYILADDLKTAINIFEAHTKDYENPVLVIKAEFVSSMVLCQSSKVNDNLERKY